MQTPGRTKQRVSLQVLILRTKKKENQKKKDLTMKDITKN